MVAGVMRRGAQRPPMRHRRKRREKLVYRVWSTEWRANTSLQQREESGCKQTAQLEGVRVFCNSRVHAPVRLVTAAAR